MPMKLDQSLGVQASVTASRVMMSAARRFRISLRSAGPGAMSLPPRGVSSFRSPSSEEILRSLSEFTMHGEIRPAMIDGSCRSMVSVFEKMRRRLPLCSSPLFPVSHSPSHAPSPSTPFKGGGGS